MARDDVCAAVPHRTKWTIFLSGTWTFFSQFHQVVLHVRFYARMLALVMFPKFDPIWNWMFRMKAVPSPCPSWWLFCFQAVVKGEKRSRKSHPDTERSKDERRRYFGWKVRTRCFEIKFVYFLQFIKGSVFLFLLKPNPKFHFIWSTDNRRSS